MAVWNGIEERFCKRLAMWTRENISKSGSITVQKHVVKLAPLLNLCSTFAKEGQIKA